MIEWHAIIAGKGQNVGCFVPPAPLMIEGANGCITEKYQTDFASGRNVNVSQIYACCNSTRGQGFQISIIVRLVFGPAFVIDRYVDRYLAHRLFVPDVNLVRA